MSCFWTALLNAEQVCPGALPSINLFTASNSDIGGSSRECALIPSDWESDLENLIQATIDAWTGLEDHNEAAMQVGKVYEHSNTGVVVYDPGVEPSFSFVYSTVIGGDNHEGISFTEWGEGHPDSAAQWAAAGLTQETLYSADVTFYAPGGGVIGTCVGAIIFSTGF